MVEGPKDAKLMELLLNSMGISDYEPAVIFQLLEFVYKYCHDVLTDASLYADHAERRDVTLDDLKLAVQTILSHSFQPPPTKQFMLELAHRKNMIPLPPIPDRFGLRLPPERYCLTSVNFDFVVQNVNDMDVDTQGEIVEPMEEDDDEIESPHVDAVDTGIKARGEDDDYD